MASLIDRFGKPKTYKARRDPKKIREKILDKTLATAIATDPNVERQWVENNYGIYVGFDNDPITNRVAELEKNWSNEALQVLGQDDKHQESAIRALVDEIKKLNALSKKLMIWNRQVFKRWKVHHKITWVKETSGKI